MNNAEWEMLKTSHLVRRVRAGEVPEDVREPIDWHRELNDDYEWVWSEMLVQLYWVMAVVVLVALAAGFIWGWIYA